MPPRWPGCRPWTGRSLTWPPGPPRTAATPEATSPATLAPCWASHDLCLYGLDILSGLWSALYLQPRRSTGLLSAQAGYQARILPALAAQLKTETSSCGHPRSPAPLPGQPWSAS